MRFWGITNTGLVRDENQDAYAIQTSDAYTLAVVCDGMGGTRGGQMASRIAVDAYLTGLRQRLPQSHDDRLIAEASNEAIADANAAIREKAAATQGYERMGTTLVSAVARDEGALISNVGDSRAYLITQGGIEQISKDHSVVESMVEKGELTPEEARHHPNRNLITRALGPDKAVSADVFPVAWQQGDFLLLCSDGLVNTVTDQEILFEVIHGGDPDDCLQRLMELACQRGAPDNVTAVLLMNI